MRISRRIYTVLFLAGFLLVHPGCEREELVPDEPDAVPPFAPKDLVVEEAQDGYVFLRWSRNTEQDLRAYIVYRKEEDGRDFRPIDSTINIYFLDEHLSYDSAYTYVVTAIDESGNESKRSNAVTATSPNLGPPLAPEDFTASGRNDGSVTVMQLEWRPSRESDLARYRIYRSEEGVPQAEQRYLIAETDAAFFSDTMIPGTNVLLSYAVTAVDAGGKGSPLSDVAADRVLDVPKQIAPGPGQTTNSSPVFSWRTVANAVTYKVIVSRTTVGDETWSWFVSAAGDTVQTAVYPGPQLAVGRLYYWRIGALSRSGTTPNSISPPLPFQVVSQAGHDRSHATP